MIIVQIRDQQFNRWESAEISLGLDRAASSFSLSVSNSYAENDSDLPIAPGDSCELFVGDALITQGYIDSINRSGSGTSRSVRIAGRSKAQDIIDCSAVGSEYKGYDVAQIARALAKPYGVSVNSTNYHSLIIDDVTINPGETAFTVIDRVARAQGYIVFADWNGGITIAKAGDERYSSALVEGENILDSSFNNDVTQRFSDYALVAQQDSTGIDFKAIGDGSNPLNTGSNAKDRGVGRFRNLTVVADSTLTDEMAKAKLDWDARRRAGLAHKLLVTVQGHLAPDGRPWRLNTSIQVVIASSYINKPHLIAGIKFLLDESEGTKTELTLSNKQVWTPDPAAAAEDDADIFGL